MKASEIEKDSDECWALWRRKLTESGIDVSKFSEIDVWHHAYLAGLELGREIESHKLESFFQKRADEYPDDKNAEVYQQLAFAIAERR